MIWKQFLPFKRPEQRWFQFWGLWRGFPDNKPQWVLHWFWQSERNCAVPSLCFPNCRTCIWSIGAWFIIAHRHYLCGAAGSGCHDNPSQPLINDAIVLWMTKKKLDKRESSTMLYLVPCTPPPPREGVFSQKPVSHFLGVVFLGWQIG